ncbi:MAG: NitrOD5 domain-containing protein [Aigarchaeota archaeon]|nr:NitrOD5 domain-containing protein [Candidatus Pelearchaeum maunauluense]
MAARQSAAYKDTENNNLITVVLNIIDEALEPLGETSKRVIFWHLANRYNVSRRDIPYKPEEFLAALREMFGAGAKILEQRMINALREHLRTDEEIIDLASALKKLIARLGATA